MEAQPLSSADVAYVTAHFHPLEGLCEGRADDPSTVLRLIKEGALPGPAYVLPDGTPMFAEDYFALADEAGGVEYLPGKFRARFIRAAQRAEIDDDVEEELVAYLSGDYAVCLRRVTPEAIVEKARLMRRVEVLLASPAPGDTAWRASLREQVDALDRLERPFAEYDRVRWGPSSRDRLITGPKELYPGVFARAEPAT